MTITSPPAFQGPRLLAARPQTAASEGTALERFQKSESEEKKNSLWAKTGLTALGVGSIGGTVGWVLKAFTGWGNAFPVCTMIGLGAGAVLGVAAWAIEHKQRQDEKKAALAASQPAPPAHQPAQGGPQIEIS